MAYFVQMRWFNHLVKFNMEGREMFAPVESSFFLETHDWNNFLGWLSGSKTTILE